VLLPCLAVVLLATRSAVFPSPANQAHTLQAGPSRAIITSPSPGLSCLARPGAPIMYTVIITGPAIRMYLVAILQLIPNGAAPRSHCWSQAAVSAAPLCQDMGTYFLTPAWGNQAGSGDHTHTPVSCADAAGSVGARTHFRAFGGCAAVGVNLLRRRLTRLGWCESRPL
jgi:hypothetical protein